MHYLTPFAFDPDDTGTDPPAGAGIVDTPAVAVVWAVRWRVVESAAYSRIGRLRLEGRARRVGRDRGSVVWEVSA